MTSGKAPLENYLQFGAIFFLLSKPGQLEQIDRNILYFLGWFNILAIAEISVQVNIKNFTCQ
jgi:hypothetical protein